MLPSELPPAFMEKSSLPKPPKRLNDTIGIEWIAFYGYAGNRLLDDLPDATGMFFRGWVYALAH